MARNPPPRMRADRESIKTVTKDIIRRNGLKTPCESCHNFTRCSIVGSAAFTVTGPHCTRNCKFCSVKHHKKPKRPDMNEPHRLAAAVRSLGLRHVVLTAVSRDDMKDFGADHFANCVREVRIWNPNTLIEVFIPDFGGRKDLIKKVMNARPDIIGHSVDTVRRLQPVVRDRKSGYRESLRVIRMIRNLSKNIIIKSSLMLGFRETRYEVLGALRNIKKAGADIMVMGQYMRPSKNHLRVLEYVPRDTFEFYEREAYQLGFRHVISKPQATHSYPSKEMLMLMKF